MTLSERLHAAERRSVQGYLRRQQLEEQRIGITQACNQCDRDLFTLDGEVSVLTALVAEEQAAKKAEGTDG